KSASDLRGGRRQVESLLRVPGQGTPDGVCREVRQQRVPARLQTSEEVIMASDLPKLFLVRHGDTAWTESRQHTGRTDIPLNERGEERARQLGERLRRFSFDRVFTSPLRRASRTCELAGYGTRVEVDSDLLEWDYGQFEGKLTRDILKARPGWELFRDGCP